VSRGSRLCYDSRREQDGGSSHDGDSISSWSTAGCRRGPGPGVILGGKVRDWRVTRASTAVGDRSRTTPTSSSSSATRVSRGRKLAAALDAFGIDPRPDLPRCRRLDGASPTSSSAAPVASTPLDAGRGQLMEKREAIPGSSRWSERMPAR
jgi:hypothetical protein